MKKAIAFGTTAVSLKLPTITAISSSSSRSKDWEDVMTCHSDDAIGRTWRVQEKRIGDHALEVEDGIIQVGLHPRCLAHNLVDMRDGVR